MRLSRFERAVIAATAAVICLTVGFFAGRLSVRTSVTFEDETSESELLTQTDRDTLRAVFRVEEEEQTAEDAGEIPDAATAAGTSSAVPATEAPAEQGGTEKNRTGVQPEAQTQAGTADDGTKAVPEESGSVDSSDSSLHNNPTLVNINTASAEELMTLPGIGEVLAQRIVDSRESDGPFAGKADIMRVSGIKEKKYADLEAYITVGP